VNDPGRGNVRRPLRRRSSRRHRLHRRIRRWLAIATIACCVGIASSVALQHLSPSLFRAERSSPPDFLQAELSRSRRLALNQILSQAPSPDRLVYPYSVVPGGVQDVKELKWVAEHDPVVAAHYAGFDYDHARVVRLTLARTAYLSYRIGNQVYWTSHRVTLHKGEKLITDGRMAARTRCANRVEVLPQQAASPAEPPIEKFDQPLVPAVGTAMKSPMAPFQSAFLERPESLGMVGPLMRFDPFTGGGWTPLAPPPVPSGLCAPSKKAGGGEKGCCMPDASGGTGKKGSPCGAPGVIPEPGTWILFASGLAAIYWQSRRKFSRA
jgi:hypothetical protein